jgi:hypothetical protein
MATAKVKSETKAPAAKPAAKKEKTKAAEKEKPKAAEKEKPKVAGSTTKKAAGEGAKKEKAKSHTTTNHDEIRAWVEKRKGTPSTVKGTESGRENTGILRIDFPGYSGKDSLEPVSWEDFFKKFDESNLEFLYQEQTSAGKESRFNKFVARK